MTIPGVCQTCGTVAPLEWFLSHGKYKQCEVVLARMPREVSYATVRYLSLFRPASGRAMSPDKALRLLLEIEQLVGGGYVQIQRLPARKCPPAVWAEAMDRMRDNPKLRCPMPNHNYLRDVAYDLADKADAERERAVVEAERNGNYRVVRNDAEKQGNDSPLAWVKTMPQREWDMLPANIREKHRHLRKENHGEEKNDQVLPE